MLRFISDTAMLRERQCRYLSREHDDIAKGHIKTSQPYRKYHLSPPPTERKHYPYNYES